MTVSLTIGLWIVPLAVTIGSLTWALWERPSQGGFFPDLEILIRLVAALIGSMGLWIAYLVWELLR